MRSTILAAVCRRRRLLAAHFLPDRRAIVSAVGICLRDLGLIERVHQIANLLRAHRNAGKRTEFEHRAEQYRSQPMFQRHQDLQVEEERNADVEECYAEGGPRGAGGAASQMEAVS